MTATDYSVRGELLITPNSNYQNYLEATAYSVREVAPSRR